MEKGPRSPPHHAKTGSSQTSRESGSSAKRRDFSCTGDGRREEGGRVDGW
jgi:hypothetical protein